MAWDYRSDPHIHLTANILPRLASLVKRLDPFLVSEHLSWSTTDGVHFNELLPLPYTEESLDVITSHVQQVQDILSRRLLIENPANYLRFSALNAHGGGRS